MTTETGSAIRGRAGRRGAAGVALLALALGACASSSAPPARPPQVGYLAPSGFPPGARSAVIQQAPELVLANIVDQLQQNGFEITALDEERGIVVAGYSGDPEPFVDCGWIVTYETGELERIPAATEAASFQRLIARDPAQLDRQLRLDGRMVVSLTPRGQNTLVSAATTYVLTKTVDLALPSGASGGRAQEIISFGTGQSGTFTKGTRCHPNGRLERIVYDGLPATSYVAQREQPAPETPPADETTAAAVEGPGAPASPPAATATAPAAPAPQAPAAPAVEPPAPRVVAEATPPSGAQTETRGARESGAPAVAVPLPAAEPIDVASLEARVDAITNAMPCATVKAEIGDDNSVQLSGYVDSEEDIAKIRQSLGELPGVGAVESELEVQPWPFCAILEVIDPYRNPDPQRGLVVTTADRETALQEGDDLTLDIFLPPDAEYLYLGYVQTDGRVGYITIMPVREWVEQTGAIRFETGFEIAGPFGREMIVAVTSARPLFQEALPAYQPPEQYVAMLRQRLAALEAGERDAALDASHLVITTRPNPAF